MKMGDSSSDESDSDDNKDQRVLKENKKNTDLKDDATKTYQAAVYKLSRQRLCAQERMANYKANVSCFSGAAPSV